MPESMSPASRPVSAQAEWRRSAFCTGGECVEVAALGSQQVGLRDSKAPGADVLVMERSQMAALLDGIKAGELDHLA